MGNNQSSQSSGSNNIKASGYQQQSNQQNHLLYDQFLPGDEVRIIVEDDIVDAASAVTQDAGNSNSGNSKQPKKRRHISEQVYRVNSVVIDDQAELDKYASRDASAFQQAPSNSNNKQQSQQSQSQAQSQHQQQPRRAIVVESIANEDDDKCGSHRVAVVVGVYQPEQLVNIPNDKHKRRRIEWRLLHNYVQQCNAKKVAPNDMIISIYSEHIRQGVYVVYASLIFRRSVVVTCC